MTSALPQSSSDAASESRSRRLCIGNPVYLLLAAMLLVVGVSATAARTIKQYQTPGPFDPSRQGMCDFHNGIYFPTLALLRGESPYSQHYADTYPVARQIPFFSPAILVLHSPIAMMPLRAGEILYFVLSVTMLIGIGLLIAFNVSSPPRMDVTIAIAAMLVFSRGGHITLFDGYFTLELILATFLAVHWGDRRPWLAAIALVLVSAKPTYILPLGFLMLARGNVKAIVIGAVLSIVAFAAPMLWLAWNVGDGDIGRGITVLQDQIATSQEIHRAQKDESPLHSWTRVDLLAILAKWTGHDPKEMTHLVFMMVILAPVMWLLDRRRRMNVDDGLIGVTGALILTTCLVSLYHQSYDLMLLVGPLIGIAMATPRTWRDSTLIRRMGLGGLMLFPLFNYASSRMALAAIDPGPWVLRIFTSLNGVCLTILIIWLWKIAAEVDSSEAA